MNRIATRYELRRTNGDPAEPYGGLQTTDMRWPYATFKFAEQVVKVDPIAGCFGPTPICIGLTGVAMWQECRSQAAM